jgi:hypothetical protein
MARSRLAKEPKRPVVDVPFDSVPQNVLDEISLGISKYFVPLLALSLEDPKHPVDLAGSGTLVELAGRHYVLTADHAWNKASSWDQLGLLLETAGSAPLAIPTNRKPSWNSLRPWLLRSWLGSLS